MTTSSKGRVLALLALGLSMAAAPPTTSPACARETDCLTRDPSTVVRRGSEYWVYGTGVGVRQFSSRDRFHWTFRGPVFPTAPDWEASAVPANRNNVTWAPDIHEFNGKYFLYYCYSTMGSNVSAIGVATNDNLDPKKWVDGGIAIRTTHQDNFNALDPCIFPDAQGNPWLSFGSYFGGIKLIAIDPRTGRQSTTDTTVYSLANHARPGNAIEGSCISYHQGYYYLFVNWDGCCNGSRSTYNIRVGRSRTVTGPYLDRDGKDMAAGGGSLFLTAVHDTGSGAPFDDEVGPGHAAILYDTDGDWFGFHEEWARDHNGATTFNLDRLAWDSDGWPRAILDPGPYHIVSNVTTHDVLSALASGKDAPLQTWPYDGRRGQKWTLRYVADGYYNILGERGRTLTIAGCSSDAGAKVVEAPLNGQPCQEWLLRQNENGTYTLLPKNAGGRLALDIGGCSIYDGVPLQVWTANGLPCQEFSFRVR